MIYNLYVSYDKVAEQYSAPFASLNDATATRTFNQSCMQNQLAEPTDFELYHVGSFSTDVGSISALDKPRFIAKGRVINNA